MSEARKLLEKFKAQEQELLSREFLSPYAPRIKHAIIKLDGLDYKLRIVGCSGTGVGIFKPIDKNCAKFIGECNDEIKENYFTLFPKIHLILSFQSDDGWVAYPINKESAQKRYGIGGEVFVRMVSDVDRFDVITASFSGLNFWHQEPFAGVDPVKADLMREAFALRENTELMRNAFDKIKGITPEDKSSFQLALSSWRIFKKQSTEGRIKEILNIGGAELNTYIVRGENIEVRWRSASGNKYNSLIKKDSFDVVSAGICLSGGDTRFHLKDLPGVIKEGEDDSLIYTTR